MNQTVINNESAIIKSIAADFPRHPRQVNGLLEADAEIIRLPGVNEEYLVLKTDGIHEEIRENLYEDPYLIGWMSVTAPVSDIAAVGAEASGILLSLVLPYHYSAEWLQLFKSGVKDACTNYGIYVIGGDTNFDSRFSVSATVVANIKFRKPLLRKGIKAGDYLYTTALLGSGNAYAYNRLFDPSVKINYKPLARLMESRLISKYATVCIDTSDGLFPALSVLSEINKIGINLTVPLQKLLQHQTSLIKETSGLPAWMFMSGPHGEYELLFSIPESLHKKFESACENENWKPVFIGAAIVQEKIFFTSESLRVQCDPSTIPNLFIEAGRNIDTYFELLQYQHKKWIKAYN